MHDRQGASCHDQTTIPFARERTDAAFDLACVADAHWMQFQLGCYRLDRAQLAASGRDGGISKHHHPGHTRHDAAASIFRKVDSAFGAFAGLTSTPMRVAVGTSWS